MNDIDDLLEYLIVTDQVDEFLGLKKENNKDKEENTEEEENNFRQHK